MSSLSHFVLHLFVLTPLCQYIVKSGRWPRSTSFLIAAFVLFSVALAVEINEQRSLPPNYYQILEIPSRSSLAEIKKAYRVQSLRLHPDKADKGTDGPGAAEKNEAFVLVTKAYEVLSDAEQRPQYDRFGPEEEGPPRSRSEAFYGRAAHSVFFYLIWIGLVYVFNIGEGGARGRSWSWCGLALLGVAEYLICYQGSDLFPPGLLPRWTLHDKFILLRNLFPSLVTGSRLMSQFTYVDKEGQLTLLLLSVLEANKQMLQMMEQIQMTLEKRGGGGGGGAGGAGIGGNKAVNLAAVAAAAAAAGAGGGGAAGEGLGLSPADGEEVSNLPLNQRLKNQKARLAAHQQQIIKEGGKKGGLPSWVVPVGLFILFNYILK